MRRSGKPVRKALRKSPTKQRPERPPQPRDTLRKLPRLPSKVQLRGVRVPKHPLKERYAGKEDIRKARATLQTVATAKIPQQTIVVVALRHYDRALKKLSDRILRVGRVSPEGKGLYEIYREIWSERYGLFWNLPEEVRKDYVKRFGQQK